MYKKIIAIVLALFTLSQADAQTFSLSGKLKDAENGAPLPGATVTLKNLRDTTQVQTTLSTATGDFRFEQLAKDRYRLSFSAIGINQTQTVVIDSANVDLGDVSVARSSKELAGVTVTSTTPPATQRGDTVQFNASQYKVNPDASSEDLVRKIPGITVENGVVKANGENVQRVTIDGRELFGDDATAALRNLPAEVIDKIQVFDRLSDQAQLTGFDDGNTTKGINIVTKANMRNGQFGRVFAGYGTDERYSAGGNATLLKENRRISLVGNFNNVNQQNFSQQDLLGVTSNAQRGGGGGGPRGAQGGGNRGNQGGGNQGGGNNGGFGSSGNFLVGQQAGINRTNAFGLNYSDIWGKKVTTTGSYFFNQTDNTTNERANVQYLSGTRLNSQDTTEANTRNTNHRVNLRIEYRIDSSNTLIITPGLSFQHNEAVRRVGRLTDFNPDGISPLKSNRSVNNTNSNRDGNNLNNTILFRHSFAKRGRSFSINLNTSYNKRAGDVYTSIFQESISRSGVPEDTATQQYNDQFNQGFQVSSNINYTEPLGANSQLQFSYNPSFSKSDADQQVYGMNPASGKYDTFLDSLSNRFENRTKAQNGGLSYRWGNRDRQISFGANYQHTNLESDQVFPRALTVNKSFSNILPNARIQYKISPKSSIRLFYRSNVNQPSVTQLQGVLDQTNAPYFTMGNPDLNQQFTSVVSSQYTYTNTAKGILLMGNVFWQTAKDYISNAVYVTTADSVVNGFKIARGSQLTKPVNLDGYSSLRSFATFAVPLKFIKSNLNLNGGFTLNKLPGIFENESIETKNYIYTLGAVVASNISQYVDFTVSYSGNYNEVQTNNAKLPTSSNFYTHVASLQSNLLNKKGWFLQNELNNQFVGAYDETPSQSYLLWNAGIGKKFLPGQKGELRLNVFDLLNQNQSIVRNVNQSQVETVENVVLQRYFMLTFTYNLRNFGKAPARPAGNGGQRRTEGEGRF